MCDSSGGWGPDGLSVSRIGEAAGTGSWNLEQRLHSSPGTWISATPKAHLGRFV